MSKRLPIRISLSVLIINIFIIFLLLAIAISPWISGDTRRVDARSMENSSDNSINYGDIIKFQKIKSSNEIITYINGKERNHQRAGSYGDVILFYPNGQKPERKGFHRAVVYIIFNSTDYDEINKSGGGYDIPSLNEYNVNGSISIDDYKHQINDKLEINIYRILKRFHDYNTTPHSGFLTKGDNNVALDQYADFTPDIQDSWIEPVEKEWIIGKYSSNLRREIISNPVCCSCYIFSFILIYSVLFAIYVNVAHRKRSKMKRN